MTRSHRSLLAGAAALVLGAAAGGASAQALTPEEMTGFLAQSVCVDASGRVTGQLPIEPGCVARPQTPGDAAPYRKHDWGAPQGFQVSDSVVADSAGRIVIGQSFDFGGDTEGRRFGVFDAGRSDGGQTVTVIDGWASIFLTEDAGGGLQYFMGEGCRTGATHPALSWLLFSAEVDTGWRQSVARLSIVHDPGHCPDSFSSAFTRWRGLYAALPAMVDGQPRQVMRDMIVSEHFDLDSIEASTHLERFYMADGLGMVRWERWENPRGFNPAFQEAARHIASTGRCPDLALSDPPGPGWLRVDCRTWTNFVRQPQGFRSGQFGWPGMTASPDALGQAVGWGQQPSFQQPFRQRFRAR